MAEITTLIDKKDNSEIVTEQIAAILAIETANQKDLADTAGKDPALWDFSITLNKAKPWAVFSNPDGQEAGDLVKGLVNVAFDSDSFGNAGSDQLRSQKANGTFFLDCYGYKNKTVDSDGVTVQAGDELASEEVDRVARLVRNIIMAEPYTYLKLGRDSGIIVDDKPVQIVQKRGYTRREKFQPVDQQQAVQNVVGCRLTLSVEYLEFGPLSELQVLDTLIADCTRDESGEIYFKFQATE